MGILRIQTLIHAFEHTHEFKQTGAVTLMIDVLDFKCPYGIFGKIADPIIASHLRSFLIERNRVLKRVAEVSK